MVGLVVEPAYLVSVALMKKEDLNHG